MQHMIQKKHLIAALLISITVAGASLATTLSVLKVIIYA